MQPTGNGTPKITLAVFLHNTYAPNRLGISARTVAYYNTSIRLFSKHLRRPATLKDLQHEVVRRWLGERLRSGSAPKTVNNNRSDLLTLWLFAHDRGYVSVGPRRLPKAKVPKRVPVAWTIGELGQILETTRRLTGKIRGTCIPKSDWWTSLILFYYDTGVRKESAILVESSHLDLRARTALFAWESDKGNCEHVEQFSAQTAEEIAKHYQRNRRYVWEYPQTQRTLGRQYKRILQAANLPCDRYRMFHCFRRTTATHMAANGSLEMARRQLGHSTQQMTERYIDPRMLDRPSAVDVLPRPELPPRERQLHLFD